MYLPVSFMSYGLNRALGDNELLEFYMVDASAPATLEGMQSMALEDANVVCKKYIGYAATSQSVGQGMYGFEVTGISAADSVCAVDEKKKEKISGELERS